MRPVAVAVVLAVSLLAPFGARGQEAITLGEKATLQSAILGESRRLRIGLPLGYQRNVERYPVLYVADGEVEFLHTVGAARFLARHDVIPKMIVVGIANRDRPRDLSPTRGVLVTDDERTIDYETSGGAGTFRRFIADELIPWIDDNYRTEPLRVLAGVSFGGLFTIDVLCRQPELFYGYIAASPMLDWDGSAPLARLAERLAQGGELTRSLYFSLGADSRRARAAFLRAQAVLSAQPVVGLRWEARERSGEDHGSLFYAALYDGLKSVFRDWALPGDEAALTVATLEAHYGALTARFGYAVRPAARDVNRIAQRALRAGREADAVALYELNAATYPERAWVHDSLGRARQRVGDLEGARVSFATAVAIERRTGGARTERFIRHLERVTELLEAKAAGAE